jgi:hypothetical protein
MSDEANSKREARWWLIGSISVALMFAFLLVLILIPNSVNHRDRKVRARHVCIAYLKTIDGAKSTWALENHKQTNDIPADSDLFGITLYIREKPSCPQGGTYTISAVNQRPRCTVPGHTL